MQHLSGVLFCALLVLVGLRVEARSVAEYLEDRAQIMKLEDASYLGSDLVLTTEETFANDYLMAQKVTENIIFIKSAKAGGKTWDFLNYFLFQKQRVRPFSYRNIFK